MFAQKREQVLVDKQIMLMNQQNLHRRKQAQSKKFINLITSTLDRQTSIKTVKQIKRNTDSLQKGHQILPIHKLFALKNSENEQEKVCELVNTVKTHRKIQRRKQPKTIQQIGLQKLSISQETQVGRGTSRIWSRENSPIHWLLEVSMINSQRHQ